MNSNNIDWKKFLDEYLHSGGDKNGTLEKLGITHKQFNLQYYTDSSFGKKCDDIENLRNKTIEDELWDYIKDEFEQKIKEGFTPKDSQKLTGFDPLVYSTRLSGSDPMYKKYNSPDFWDKYKVLYDPQSKDPDERLDYEIHYREKLLKLKQGRFDRDQIKRDKRKQKVREIKLKLQSSLPPETLEEKIDWELEKIIKRTDKKIKDLQDRITKNKIVGDQRIKSQEKLQKEKVKGIKQREEQRKDLYKKKLDDQKERRELTEKLRGKRFKERIDDRKKKRDETHKRRKERIKEREELLLKDFTDRLEKRKDLVKQKIDSKKLVEMVKQKVVNQTIPSNIKKQVSRTNRYGTQFYDVDNRVVFSYCSGCDEYKGRDHFHKRGKNVNTYCIPCTRKRMGLDPEGGRRGSVYKGIKLKKYNKNGNEVERRCSSCKKFKPTNDFRYKFQSSYTCKDCYVKLPNNHLTRMGEIIDGVQVRWYDPKTFEVTHKKCNQCDKKKPRNDYTMVTKSIDGISGKCKPCSKEYRKYLKKKKQGKLT